jgi:cytochrome P450
MKPFTSSRQFKMWLGPELAFIPLNPEDIKTLMNSESCQDKPLWIYEEVSPYGLLSSNGQKLKLHKKVASPAFQPKSLKSFLPKTNRIANEFLMDFESRLKSEVVDVSRETSVFMFKATFASLFDVKSLENEVCVQKVTEVNE